jgi:hypothetical protein
MAGPTRRASLEKRRASERQHHDGSRETAAQETATERFAVLNVGSRESGPCAVRAKNEERSA